MQELRYKVVYGYGKNDFISIPDTMLERAIYAYASGKIFTYNGKSRRGSEIKGIEPDINYYTGWNPGYDAKGGEDYDQIKRDVPQKEIQQRIQQAHKRVETAMRAKRRDLLETPEKLDKLMLESNGKN